ncbi:hypothetical protein [Enterococcus malodoratus]|uniref:hypothetical protein n=1 Tax=Enterococcus malodoratus TaxID=71451 RepID=UPI0039AF61F5
MNARKFGTVAAVTALSTIALGGFIKADSTNVHAAANFTQGDKETRNPMGAALGSTMAKKTTFPCRKRIKGIFQAGQPILGRVWEPVRPVQLQRSK